MPKFLVHQVLSDGGDLVHDHLEPRARELADQLADPESVDVTWLWGCANIDRNEWHMLYEAEDEEVMASFIGVFPGIRSVTRVLHVTPDNLAWVLVSGIADGKRRRDAQETGDGDSAGAREDGAREDGARARAQSGVIERRQQ